MKVFLLLILISICLSGCSGCSKSGRKNQNKSKTVQSTNSITPHSMRDNNSRNGTNVVQMRKENGIFLVPTKINGISMEFIFDTGASNISISETEALFLYKQGKLKEEDFIGKQNFIDANGDISEGTIVNLKTVEIGNRTLTNVQASIVNNLKAPLLLGQSALSQFGKISIDYNKEEIKFE